MPTMQVISNESHDSSVSHRHQHHHSPHRKYDVRPKTFVTPKGRKVHVAACPRTAQALRKELEELHPNGDFDLYIHGSPEHIEALKQTHSHHKHRRNKLRQMHGETFDECENINRELDHLSTELHRLTEHDVSLDATFSKYGYGAHLRTYDQSLHPTCSSVASEEPGKPPCPKAGDSPIREDKNSPKFYRQPVIRQYFHKGLLWRASGSEEVGPFELFVDLLYVGIISIIGERASAIPTGEHLHRYFIFFILTWKIWNDLMLSISWFETDDILQKLYILLTITCLMGFSMNMLMAFAGQTWAQLISFYLATRVIFALFCLLQAYYVPMVRAMMFSAAASVVIPLALWIASIYVELPRRFILIWIAMLLDSFGLTWTIFLQRDARRVSAKLEAWYDRHFELYPAINIEHKSERTKQFVTLVIGYAVVGLFYQSSASFGINAFFGKAILGLAQGFAINWIYFEIDGKNIHVHAIRRHVGTSLLWLSLHLPFVMALGLAGAALSRLVVAHDCSNAHLDDLSNLITDYEERSVGKIPDGLRWFYCAGLGASTLAMAGISASHIHKEFTSPRITKTYRFIYRVAVGLVLTSLGFAHSLDSLELIGTTTALVTSVLAIDIYGSSNSRISFFGASDDALTSMNYTARCQVSREDIRNATETDRVLDVEKLGTVPETCPGGGTIYRASFQDGEMRRTMKADEDQVPEVEKVAMRPRGQSLFRASFAMDGNDLRNINMAETDRALDEGGPEPRPRRAGFFRTSSKMDNIGEIDRPLDDGGLESRTRRPGVFRTRSKVGMGS